MSERRKKRGSDVDRRGIVQLNVAAFANGLRRGDENGKLKMPHGRWKEIAERFPGISRTSMERWLLKWDRELADDSFPDFASQRDGKVSRPTPQVEKQVIAVNIKTHR